MNIDITKAPELPEILDRRRSVCNETLGAITTRERLYTLICYAISFVGIAVIALQWNHGLIGPGALVGAIAGAGAVAGVPAFAVTVVVAYSLVSGGYDALLVIGTFAAVFTFSYLNSYLHRKWIVAPRTTANNQLLALTELDSPEFREAYIAFNAWRDEDDMIRTFFNRLVDIGRKPVVAEYQAAKAWIEGKSIPQLVE